MMVQDNYGAKWVKSILQWFKSKTEENGYEADKLVKEALIECGLRKGKAIEIMNEFIDMGFISSAGGMIFWKDTKPDNPKMSAYYEAKRRFKMRRKRMKLKIDRTIEYGAIGLIFYSFLWVFLYVESIKSYDLAMNILVPLGVGISIILVMILIIDFVMEEL